MTRARISYGILTTQNQVFFKKSNIWEESVL